MELGSFQLGVVVCPSTLSARTAPPSPLTPHLSPLYSLTFPHTPSPLPTPTNHPPNTLNHVHHVFTIMGCDCFELTMRSSQIQQSEDTLSAVCLGFLPAADSAHVYAKNWKSCWGPNHLHLLGAREPPCFPCFPCFPDFPTAVCSARSQSSQTH